MTLLLRLLFCTMLAFTLASCASSSPSPKKTAGRKMVVRTTAYTAAEPGGAHAANGERLHFGGPSYSAAADWSWLPLGTRFKMAETGREYIIEDYGSALVGKQTIDLYMPSGAAMRAWGTRQVNIEILEMGSKTMSLRLLEPRQKAGYVQKMVAALKNNPSPAHPASIGAAPKNRLAARD